MPNKEIMWPQDFVNKIICGDCVEIMGSIPSESIDMILTSPPYDELRDYRGYVFDFEKSAREIYRVLKKRGVIVWVVGDMSVDGSETGTSFKQVLYFKDLGLSLHDTMIYEKGGFPNPSSNRYHQVFEFMFVLSKGKPKIFNPIKDRKNIYEGSKSSTQRQRDGSLKRMKDIIFEVFGMRYNIWKYEIGYGKSAESNIAYLHPAVFPFQLAIDHIKSWSNKGDIVLDPLIGSGTTARAAKDLHRTFIGIEIDPEYCKIAKERLAQGVL